MQRDASENKDAEAFSFTSYYKELIQSTSMIVKLLFCIAIGLIISGYLVRGFDIYFFWESKSFGYTILMIFILLFLRKDISKRKSLQVKNIWCHIGFWLIVFILFVKTLIVTILPNSDAYEAAKNHLKNDAQLVTELGEIQGFTVLPNGGIQVNSSSVGTYGTATIELIIKGSEKYKELIVYVEKTPDTDWTVVGIR